MGEVYKFKELREGIITYNISKSQHGEVAIVIHTGKDEFSRKWKFGRFSSARDEIVGRKMESLGNHIDRILCWSGCNTNHYVWIEDVGGEKDPKDIIYEETH